MTRETKIGLLVGLAFIIVIGILLSDHLTSTLQPPQAPLGVAAPTVREGVNSPGVGQVSRERSLQVPEASPNPLVIQSEEPRRAEGRTEVTILPPPASSPSSSSNQNLVIIPPANQGEPGERVVIPPPQQEVQPEIVRGVTPQFPPAFEAIRKAHPEEFVTVPTEGVREYRAEPGDTISQIARRELGADTRVNRDAIFRLNPSLRNNPQLLRAGQTYMIPMAGAIAPPTNGVPVGTTVGTPSDTGPVAISGENVYTTRSGDTLWRIAINQVGSHTAVEQIKELNKHILKGGDRIKPGMKLRLPTRSVATSTQQADSSL